ncbi:hypothetical protein PsorP6_007797 [Peronosclerospora sorghi]|uniref:Uncharacterized protein n=1 Tax=Peronosclerospora sorghi TaxID=230839 RepID=A0ACC0WAL3_9STRA|nr:hypothetical protein PsorP6_007797 [Peronosclerospora sorghi]
MASIILFITSTTVDKYVKASNAREKAQTDSMMSESAVSFFATTTRTGEPSLCLFGIPTFATSVFSLVARTIRDACLKETPSPR